MWSAFMNGSGLHGGGGAGGGYVPSQGWEYMSRSRMERTDRNRGKNRSPLRRISSPPTVFSQSQEPQFGASPSGGEGGASGTQILDILRGQMWPGPEPQQQQQAQHTRLKKKLEDLKKRHVQEKEEWMREKESLLREVANIQGGENRRILLDLKTVLEEVQAEVKREEEKRSELQLQYTRDICAWELEKAELKCRIAQLEAREATGLASGGLQSASRSPRELHGETSVLRREREEQRKILTDTHSAAMDLRYRLEHSERDWLREKAELLERFDVERKEWESQLKDMQRKIEELYCEVGVKRGGARQDGGKQDDDIVRRFSMRSTSTGSSLQSDNSHSELLSCSTQSEPTRNPSSPHFGHARNISNDVSGENHHSTCFQADDLLAFNVGGQFSQSEHFQPELRDELRSRRSWQQESVADNKEAVDTSELDAIHHGVPGYPVQEECTSKGAHIGLHEKLVWGGWSFGSEKKKNNTALNAALKEIARVSEELCSYQDEVRKKSGDKRNQSESLCPSYGNEKSRLQADEAPCDLSQIYDDLRALEREHWNTLSPDNTWQANKEPSESWTTDTADLDVFRATQTNSGVYSEIDTPAPPIPPRTSSWNLNASNPDTELHIPESPMASLRKCHSPCVLVDRKCNSPSIVRKFEAMLQENEGKVFKDGVVTSCPVPSNSNCNVGCCHNRWSCDASKFTRSKLSAYGTVQKSFSEVNILSAGKDLSFDCSSGKLQTSPSVRELPLDVLLSSLATPPASPSLQDFKRNIVLEKKTAEFNKTLFQAEMGRGADVQDSFTVTDTDSVACQPGITTSDDLSPSGENTFQPISSDFTTAIIDAHPKVSLSLSKLDSITHNSQVQPRQIRCSPELQEVRIKSETPPVLSSEQPLAGLCESPAHHCEVNHKVRAARSPSRKSQLRAATEALSLDPVFPANPQPGQDPDANMSKTENIYGAKSQTGRASVSQTQPSVQNKQRQVTQSRHMPGSSYQSDSSRSVPRMMNDHPWKPLTLAAYPRPEGSRSNYGAVERILKNYENAARAQESEMDPGANFSCRWNDKITEQDVLEMNPPPLPSTLRHLQTSNTSQTQSSQVTAQVNYHSAKGVKEVQLIVQENEECSVTSSSIQKNFSRPARPANRRLPSRWASRSPTSSSSASSSPSTTPVLPSTFIHQKHTSPFTYSHGFHIETVII